MLIISSAYLEHVMLRNKTPIWKVHYNLFPPKSIYVLCVVWLKANQLKGNDPSLLIENRWTWWPEPVQTIWNWKPPRASAQTTQRHFHQNDPIHPCTYLLFFRRLPTAQVLHPSNLFGQLPQLLLTMVPPSSIKWMTGLKSTISSIKLRTVPGTRISVGPSFAAHSWVHSRRFGSVGSSTEVAGDGDGMAGRRSMGGAAEDKLREPTRILSEELQKPTLKLTEKIHAKLATTNKPSNLQKHRVTTTIQPSNHPTIQPSNLTPKLDSWISFSSLVAFARSSPEPFSAGP